MEILSQAGKYLSQYAPVIYFYLPIGIIGVWRWSVWLIRKFISLFYQMPGGYYPTTISVVTPVYNEDPALFRRALDSWKDNGVDEIIAVVDYSDQINIQLFREFSRNFSGAKLIITPKPGKRPALANGTKAATSEIVALVDSDTFWSPDIKDKLLGPFSDPEVGGLVTRQDVFETDTLAKKLFKILLDDRYLYEYPFLATASDALLCLSGRTAVYRRIAIIDNLDELENETFWGKKMISGDDKALTRLVHKDGWKTRFLRDVTVYTSGMASLKSFLKQKLRWTRNGLRSDSKVVFSGWVWKRHKILALHMLDKFISPLTLLLSPIFFVMALYLGHWQIAVIIFTWWIISRTIKIYPHLKENPYDVFILPAYIFMTFVMAVVKVYALITIDEQGWITRWHKSRFAPLNFFRKALSYTATAVFVFGLFFFIFNYKNAVLRANQLEKQKAQELNVFQSSEGNNIFTPDLPRLSQNDVVTIKNDLLTSNQNDPYGYYVAKAGDTISILKRRYNIPPNGQVLDAKTKAPLGNFAFLSVGQSVAIPISDLRNPIDKNILITSRFAKPPRITYDPVSNTIFVKQSGSVATLTKINQSLSLANRHLVQQTAPGEWILRANLYIGKNVTLVLDGNEVKYLKLKSDSAFVWLRSESGNMLISNTKITSWDEKTNSPDVNDSDGRAYITAKNSGRMDIINSDLGYLGYVGYPKRGGLFGGSYGVSWKIKNGGLRDSLLTGVVIDSRFHNNYFGFYTFGVTGMLVRGNEAYENVEYGFDPHDDSNNMLIENNQTYNNGNHGIILSKRCFNNIIAENISHDNRLHGIMLDRSSNNNVVENNTVYGNVDGIALYGSDKNLIINNKIRNNVRGIRLNAGSAQNYYENNQVHSNERGIYIYDQSQKNILVENSVKDNNIGVTIKNASLNSLYDNFRLSDNKRDGRITTDSRENNIQ